MPNELLAAALLSWLAAGAAALTGRLAFAARGLLALGALCGIAAALLALPGGTDAVLLPTRLAGDAVGFRLSPAALWLMGFGLAPAVLACWLASPAPRGHSQWLFGAALSLIGALGVFGLDNGAAFLVAWEIMSFGGAVMLLGERLSPAGGRSVLFMLALLEVGAVALVLAVVLLADAAGSLSFALFPMAALSLSGAMRVFVVVLLVIGFGAKLGLLPFYEWFPSAYGSGSGASGALMSGVVLNAGFFGLSRGLLEWLPGVQAVGATGLGEFVVVGAVLSAILSALYAFQQEDWRTLLSLSSAENSVIAVAALGASLMFRGDHLPLLASLAWTVALLHLAGHALAKGGLFLAADGVFRATGTYAIQHTDLAAARPAAVRRRHGFCRDESGGDAAASRLCQRMVHLSDCVPGLSSVEFGQPADIGIGRRRPCPDRSRRLRRVCKIDRHRPLGARRRTERPTADGYSDRSWPPRARGVGACRRHALLADERSISRSRENSPHRPLDK